MQIEDWSKRAFRIEMCEFRPHDLFLWLPLLIMNLLTENKLRVTIRRQMEQVQSLALILGTSLNFLASIFFQ